ncbi:Uncharacterized protein APZ42_005358, partial [Daphnia magna]
SFFSSSFLFLIFMMIGKTRNSKLLNKVANVDKTSTQRTRKQKLIKMMELMVKEH